MHIIIKSFTTNFAKKYHSNRNVLYPGGEIAVKRDDTTGIWYW